MSALPALVSAHSETWLQAVSSAAWQGAAVGLCALVLAAWGRRWPSPLRYGLLLLALLKFAIPPFAAGPTGVFSALPVAVAPERDPDSRPPPPRHDPALIGRAERPLPAISGTAEIPISNTPAAAASVVLKPVEIPPVTASASAPVAGRLAAVLMWTHLAGAAAFLALCGARRVQLGSARRRGLPAGPDVVHRGRRVAAALGLARVPAIWLSPDNPVPYSAGLWRPEVILPAAGPDEWSPDELDAVLAHEMAHHRRGDLWVNLFQIALGALWWFHPVVWLLNRAIRRVREECCDDLLLTRALVTDEGYCQALIRVASAGVCRPVPAGVSMLGGTQTLKRRMRRILDESLPRRARLGLRGLVALAAVALLALPGLRTAPAETEDDTKETTIAAVETPDKTTTAAVADALAVSATAGRSPPEVAERALRGRILDEQGQPISGATIALRVLAEDEATGAPAWSSVDQEGQSDETGNWSLEKLPRRIDALILRVRHPDYVPARQALLAAAPAQERLKTFDELVLKRGVPVTGRVVDEQGAAIAAATVSLTQVLDNFETQAQSDAEGNFSLGRCPTGDGALCAFKPGHAPHSRLVALGAEGGLLDVALAPGNVVRVRLTDRSGAPIPGARIMPVQWPDSAALVRLHQFGETDADGLWTWDWAPDAAWTYAVYKPGHRRINGVALAPHAEPHELTLLPELRLALRVLDDATDAPVPTVRAAWGLIAKDGAQPTWLPAAELAETDGRFSLTQDLPSAAYVVRIEAAGYLPEQTRTIVSREDEAALTVRLRRAREIAGVVRGADGTPVEGATVHVGTATRRASLGGGPSAPPAAPVAVTGRDGGFRYAPPTEEHTLFVVADAGFAQQAGASADAPDEAPREITLQAWGRVTGTLRRRDALWGNQTIHLRLDEKARQGEFGPHGLFEREALTDAEGRFVFERLPPGTEPVVRHVIPIPGPLGAATGEGASARLRLASGQDCQLALGGTGRTIVGRFRMADDTEPVDWEACCGVLLAADKPAPADIVYRSPAHFRLDREGRFQIDDVLPGTYRIQYVSLRRTDPSRPNRQSGAILTTLTVINVGDPEAPPLDLGALTIPDRAKK